MCSDPNFETNPRLFFFRRRGLGGACTLYTGVTVNWYLIFSINYMCIGGLSGAIGKVSGAIGDFAAKLTGDDEFQEARRRTNDNVGSNLEGAAKVQ